MEPKPTDAEVEALLASAKATRKRPSRGLWIAALVVSVVCVAGLAYGLITSWDAEPEKINLRSHDNSGFVLGLMIGIGIGVALGTVLALRKRT